MRKETASICQAVTQPTMLTIPILLACKMPVKNMLNLLKLFYLPSSKVAYFGYHWVL